MKNRIEHSSDDNSTRCGPLLQTGLNTGLLARLRQTSASAIMGVMVGVAVPAQADIVDLEETIADQLEEETRGTRRTLLPRKHGEFLAGLYAEVSAAHSGLDDSTQTRMEKHVLLGYQVAPNSTASLVGKLLHRLAGLDRTELICTWALSTNVSLRHSLAMALPLLPCDVGVPEAIAVLTRDRVAQVRVSAEEAATRLHNRVVPDLNN